MAKSSVKVYLFMSKKVAIISCTGVSRQGTQDSMSVVMLSIPLTHYCR